jgi:hypothetical protein
MVWGYEKISDHLNKKLAEKLKDTPPDRIVTPNPAVAGPTVEALRFVANEAALREMYTNLLATSMNAETAQNAHPAFVETIRQMVADEARIVNLIAAEESVIVSQVFLNRPNAWGHDRIEPSNISMYAYLAKKPQCEFPSLIPSYLDNLRRLGVTRHEDGGEHRFTNHADGRIAYKKDGHWTILTPTNDSSAAKMIRWLLEEELSAYKGTLIGFLVRCAQVKFTSFGRQFVDSCVTPPSPQ